MERVDITGRHTGNSVVFYAFGVHTGLYADHASIFYSCSDVEFIPGSPYHREDHNDDADGFLEEFLVDDLAGHQYAAKDHKGRPYPAEHYGSSYISICRQVFLPFTFTKPWRQCTLSRPKEEWKR